MTQADCVVLMLAYAATIPVVLLTAGSNESADPIASRRCWEPCQSIGRNNPRHGRRYRRSVCPVGSVFPFAESETASAGPVEKAGALKLALNQLTAAEI